MKSDVKWLGSNLMVFMVQLSELLSDNGRMSIIRVIFIYSTYSKQ